MLIKRIEQYLDVDKLQEDLRKLGVNFITAGGGTLVIAHSTGLTQWLITSSCCVIIGGVIVTFLGLLRRNNNG